MELLVERATFTWSPTKVPFDLLNVYHKVLLQNLYFKGGKFMVINEAFILDLYINLKIL